MKCIILAAGYATRLSPLTDNYPKPLLKVKDKTILDWLIEDLESKNYISDYIIVSNHKFIDIFNSWLLNNKYKNKINIIDDGTISNDTRLGAVKDIELAINKCKINSDTLVIAGDNLLDFSLNEFIEYFKIKDSNCVMRYFEENINKIKKSSCLEIDSNDKVINMLEKPELVTSNYCCPPFYIYKKDTLKLVKEALNDNCKYDAPGSFISWLCNKSTIYAFNMPGNRYDIGTLDSYNFICSNYNGIK